MFSVHTKTKRWRIKIPHGLRRGSEKLRFRDELVWTVGLTIEIKLRFQIYPALSGRCLNEVIINSTRAFLCILPQLLSAVTRVVYCSEHRRLSFLQFWSRSRLKTNINSSKKRYFRRYFKVALRSDFIGSLTSLVRFSKLQQDIVN